MSGDRPYVHKNVSAQAAPCKKQNEEFWVVLPLFQANVPDCLPKEGSSRNHLTWVTLVDYRRAADPQRRYAVYCVSPAAMTKCLRLVVEATSVFRLFRFYASWLGSGHIFFQLSRGGDGGGATLPLTIFIFVLCLSVHMCADTCTHVHRLEVHLGCHSLSAIHLDF